MNKKYILGALIISVVVNLFLIFKLADTHGSSQENSLESQIEKYPFISKRILADVPNDYLINFIGLRNELNETILPYEDSFAFYFEYLPTGVSVTTNSNDDFTAASLLKVPVVMANLLQEEIEGDRSMPDTITLTPEMLDSNYGTLYQRGAGAEITRDEAIKYALEESDNTALAALLSITDRKYFDRVTDGLDVEISEINQTPVITAREYSSILRALYFASIVNKEHSQAILEHLTKSKFKDKLAAGVPSNIPVANKIGVLDGQLYTDCGIVYIPRRNYLLCMISASDEATARERMKGMSQKVYEFVSSANKEMSKQMEERN